jgi:hypothetical protein
MATRLVVLNLGDTYTELGATALDACDGDLTASVVQGGDTVDTNTVGTYQVTYSVSDGEGNAALTVTRTVDVVDTTNPFVQSVNVLNSTEVEVVFNKNMGLGADVAANYTISGAGRGTLTANPVSVTPVGAVPTATFVLTWAGCPDLMRNGADVTITVNAAVQDEFGNVMAAPFSRTDVAAASQALPVITLNGTTPASVECATTYTDAGATALNACGASLTVTPTSTVNTAVVGAYTVTYNATDAAGNAAVAVVRTVNVVDTTAPVITRLTARARSRCSAARPTRTRARRRPTRAQAR